MTFEFQQFQRWQSPLGAVVASAISALALLYGGVFGALILLPWITLQVAEKIQWNLLSFFLTTGFLFLGAVLKQSRINWQEMGVLLLALWILCLGFGSWIRRKRPVWAEWLLGTAGFTAVIIAVWLASGIFRGQDPLLTLRHSVGEVARTLFQQAKDQGIIGNMPALSQAFTVDALVRETVELLPTFLFIGSLGIVLLNLALSHTILRRVGYSVCSFSISRWRLPKSVGVVLFIIAMFGFVSLRLTDSEWVRIFARNELFIMGVVLVISGLSSYYRILSGPAWTKWLIIFVLLILLRGWYLFAALGIADMFLDLKEKLRRLQEGRKS